MRCISVMMNHVAVSSLSMVKRDGAVCPQAYTSVGKATLALKDFPDLAKIMNMTQFHTKMMDNMDELLQETSELSILW